MLLANYQCPGKSLLQRFGFEALGINGFFQTNYRPGVLSVLVISNGVASLYEESEWEEEQELEEPVFRIKNIPISNDEELNFILLKIFS